MRRRFFIDYLQSYLGVRGLMKNTNVPWITCRQDLTLFWYSFIDNRKCYRNTHGRVYGFCRTDIGNWTRTIVPRSIHQHSCSVRSSSNLPWYFYIDIRIQTFFVDSTSSDIDSMSNYWTFRCIHYLTCKIRGYIGNLQVHHSNPNHLFGTSWTDIGNLANMSLWHSSQIPIFVRKGRDGNLMFDFSILANDDELWWPSFEI